MNVLVTGGAGFIGSHLVESLLRQGHKVVCLDNFDTYYDPGVKRANIQAALAHSAFTLVEGDIRDKVLVERNLESNDIQLVVHLAARAGVRPSIEEPGLYYDVNVMGTLALIEAMRNLNVKRLIFASSSSVYGNNTKVPFSEDDNVDYPISPYAATKRAGELLCHTYHHLYGFDVFCLRFFTAYGPRQRPEMAIHQFIRKIRLGEPVPLFGDGTTRRDYTYIDKIVEGIVASMDRLEGYEVINLGESQTTSLIDLVRIIEDVCRKKAQIRWLPMQPGDVQSTNADIAKARRLLAYHPQQDLREGIRRTVHWYDNERSGDRSFP